jgi:hypothetical protein
MTEQATRALFWVSAAAKVILATLSQRSWSVQTAYFSGTDSSGSGIISNIIYNEKGRKEEFGNLGVRFVVLSTG